MKTPTWQLSTLPRCPHHWRLTPIEWVPRLGKLLGSKAMMPWRGANELLDDLSLDIDERGDVLGIFAGQVRQQPLEIEVQVALSDLSLQRLLIGHDELGQTIDHGGKDVRRNDAVAQQRLSPLCPGKCHL